jgi:hypothetical protein
VKRVLAALVAIAVGALVGLRLRPSGNQDVTFAGPEGLSSILLDAVDGRDADAWARLLGARDPSDRAAAAFAVRELREPAAHLPSLRALLADPSPDVRFAALEAIGMLRAAGAPALAEIVARLDDPDPGVRRAAQRAAPRLGGAAGPALLARYEAAQDEGRAVAKDALARLDAAARAPLVPALRGHLLGEDPVRAEDAAELLAGAGDPGVAALCDGIADPRSLTSVTAIVALGRAGAAGAAAVPALEAALPRRAVREAALDALAALAAAGRAALERAATSSDEELASAAKERLR